MDGEALGDRQRHQVCMGESKAVQIHVHNTIAAASVCLGYQVALKSVQQQQQQQYFTNVAKQCHPFEMVEG